MIGMPVARPAAVAEAAIGTPLVDRFGRVHRDLRISLTDRCSLRCTYCMPEQGNEWLARESILDLDEIERVARVAAADGVTTFRLTGGEPLLRRDIVDVVRRLAAVEGPTGPVQIAMTTNGIRLPEVLDDLDARYAGIKGRILDEAGSLRRFVNVYVGNDDVRFLDELATPTPDGTQISVIPAVAGG